MIVCLAISLTLFACARFNYRLFRPWVASWNLACIAKEAVYRRLTPIIAVLLIVLATVPPILFLFLWGVSTSVRLSPDIVGVFVICLGLSAFSIVYALLYWRINKWRITPLAVVMLVIGLAVIAAFLITLLIMMPPVSYTGLSFIFCAFNMFPMTIIVHLFSKVSHVDFNTLVEKADFNADGSLKIDAQELEVHRGNGWKVHIAVLYVIAVGILLAYALLVWFLTTSQPGVGFVSAGCIIVLDVCVYFYYQSGLLTSPSLLALTLTGVRAAFISWGPELFFLGHCTVVLVVTFSLGYQVVTAWFPLVDTHAEIRSQLHNPEKVLLKLRDAALEQEQTGELPRGISQSFTSSAQSPMATGAPLPAEHGGAALSLTQRLNARSGAWPILMLVVLTLAFVADIIAIARIGSPIIPNVTLPTGTQWSQYLFGLVTLLLALVLPMAYLSHRLYKLNNYELNVKCIVAYLFLVVFSVGTGIFLFFLSYAYTVLWLSICLPITFGSAVVAFNIWVKNDYDFLAPASKRARRPPMSAVSAVSPATAAPATAVPASTPQPSAADDGIATPTGVITTIPKDDDTPPPNAVRGFFCGMLPRQDYLMIVCTVLLIGSIVALGALIAETAAPQPKWVGWTIALALGLFVMTFLPLWKWFNTFEFDWFIPVTSLIAVGLLAGWCGGMLSNVYYVGTTYGLAVIFFTIMYPICVLAGVGFYQWRDDDWKLEPSTNVHSRFVVLCLSLTGIIIVGFDVALFVLAWIAGLAVLFAVVALGYCCLLLYVWYKNKFFLATPWKISLIVLLFVVAGLGVGVGFISRPFYGFSASWACLFAALFVLAVRQELQKYIDPTYRVQYSRFIFPVYKYNVTTDDIETDNRHVGYTYAALVVAGVWGILAAVFLYPVYIGLGITALMMVFTIIYTAAKLRIPLDDFANCAKFLNQQLLTNSMKQAFDKQVNKDFDLNSIVMQDVESQAAAAPKADLSLSRQRFTTILQEYEDAFSGDKIPLTCILAHVAIKLQKPTKEVQNWLYRLQEFGQVNTTEKLLAVAPADFAKFGLEADVTQSLSQLATQPAPVLTEQQVSATLRFVHRQVAHLFDVDTRFRVHFQILAVFATEFQRQREEVMWQEILQRMKVPIDLTIIRSWSAADHTHFRAQFDAFRGELQQHEDEMREKQEKADEAQRKRDELLRQKEEDARLADDRIAQAEEERRQAELEAARQEAERQRLLTEQRLEEQRRQREQAEAAQADAERQEQLRKLKERLAAERAERERKAAQSTAALEVEERRKHEEEERRKAEQAEAQRKAEIAAMKERHRLLEEQRKAQAAAKAEAERQEQLRLLEEKQRLEMERLQREKEQQARLEEEQRRKQQSAGSAGPADDIDMQTILAEIGASGKWEDKQFEHGPRCIGEKLNPDRAKLIFVRADEMYTNPTVFVDKAAPEDIEQGMLGDCWFLSAISVLATHEDLLTKVFIDTTHAAKGVFLMQFFKNGEWRKVVIDDYFPAEPGPTPTPAFVHSKRFESRPELWMMLLEKAYAKLHGSYEAIELGSVAHAFVDLTGGAGEDINMSTPDVQKDIFSGAMWAKLVDYLSKGYLLGAGSPAGSDADISSYGIVQGHAYAILDLKEVDGFNLLKLRNPWGQTEWNGKWSDGWEGWTRRLKAKVGLVQGDDGSFWMELSDFAVHFRTIYVCRIFKDMPSKTVRSAWDVKTAGGCVKNTDTFVNNPQFLLKLTRPASCFITLRQQETRGTGRKPFHIGYMIFDKKGKRARTCYASQLVGKSGDYINSRETSAEFNLQPKLYTIVPTTFNAGEKAEFSMNVYCDDPDFDFELLPDTIDAV
eukprot:TRINITY_DN725_c0_g1_i3.p1 TRINITY_DN725_c0_g1~~TRINITY_DN725_c0_g1_i3.p1  ORF type:complete len:1823 (+),score=496.75 TRINITY_DN725_c0_g1_i3:2151-7619(+)